MWDRPVEEVGLHDSMFWVSRHPAGGDKAQVRFGSRLCENASERRTLRIVFSMAPCQPALTSAIGFRDDEIEMEILRASSASEFSHSLGQKAKYSLRAHHFRFASNNGHSPG